MNNEDELRDIIGQEFDARNKKLTNQYMKNFFMIFAWKWAILIGLGILGRKLRNSEPNPRPRTFRR